MITVINTYLLSTAAAVADANDINKEGICKNCAPFTNCISEIKILKWIPKTFM